jgi:hypothetical protein
MSCVRQGFCLSDGQMSLCVQLLKNVGALREQRSRFPPLRQQITVIHDPFRHRLVKSARCEVGQRQIHLSFSICRTSSCSRFRKRNRLLDGSSRLGDSAFSRQNIGSSSVDECEIISVPSIRRLDGSQLFFLFCGNVVLAQGMRVVFHVTQGFG